jgi:tRNA A-37 threonylcarbamoyl transferase component Bud32
MRFEATTAGVRHWFYLKRVHHPRLGDQWDRIMCGSGRISSCRHEQKMIKALGQCRVPAPVVVAWAEKMVGCYERASALITLGLIGQSLELFVPKYFSRAADRPELVKRRSWIRKLAELIGRFHQNGFCHRDLYLSHIFISFRKNGEPVFYLIDLARCFKMGLRRQRWILKDLSALNFSSPMRMISRTDRMRFFLTYLGKSKLEPTDKKLVRKIIAKCERIEQHNRKHQKVTKERALK